MSDQNQNHNRIENYQTRKAHEPAELKPVLSEDDLEDLDKERAGQHPLEHEDVMDRLKRVEDWWRRCVTTLADSRVEMMTDHEYYDNEQWTEEEKDVLEERGQEPVVFNVIATAIDWILGAERRQRVDWHVLPRTKQDVSGAEAKTKLLKYVSDSNNVPLQRSMAFEDAVKGGVGWLEAGARSDPTKERVYVQWEDWRNIWYDALARRNDLSDARFIFRSKWVDLDVAMLMWPDRAASLKAAAFTGHVQFDEQHEQDAEMGTEGTYDLDSEVAELGEGDEKMGRSRVRLIECWYKSPSRVRVMKGEELGVLDGEEYDEHNPDHVALVEEGHASIIDAMRQKVRLMIYTGNVVLQDDWSPYRHNRFPFVPIFAKRRKKDGSPYGPIRNMRSPQNDLNKRRSKALFILSTNKIIADENATDDWEELQDEAARPDGVIRKKAGTELEIVNETALADAHTQLMDQDAMYIQDASGVTNENMGRDTNAVSGKAIEAKQDQGRTVTIRIFDNHKHAFQSLGDILLSLIEQFYSESKEIRILKDRGKPEWVEINMPQPDGTLLNDISASKADFIISETDYNDSLRQALFESLSEMITNIDPSIAMQLLDLVVDLSDLPGKEEIVSRIREITGMDDPYADPDDPEAMKKREAREQQKAEEAEMERQRVVAEVEQAQAEVEKARADTQKSLYDAEKTRYQAIFELAKVDTERAKQEATKAGIKFDEIKLRIERAKALDQIENSQAARQQTKNESGSIGAAGKKPVKRKDKMEGQYHEKGLKSNNQKQRWKGRETAAKE